MDTFQRILQFIEDDTSTFRQTYEVTSAIAVMRDDSLTDSEAKRLQWEIDALNFSISKGKLTPISQQTSWDGKVIHAYPSLEIFGAEGLEYLHSRAIDSTNAFLNARYFMLLWSAPGEFRHEDTAKLAIDALLGLLDKKAKLTSIDVKDELEQLAIFECAVEMVAKIYPYRAGELKTLANHWLFTPGLVEGFFSLSLIETILDYPKIWKTDELLKLPGLLENIMDIYIKKPDFFMSERAFRAGERLASKLQQDVKFWHNKLGAAYEAFAKHRMDDESRMIPLGFLGRALASYQAAKNEAKVSEIGNRYQRVSKELQLSEITVPLPAEPLRALMKYGEARAKKLLERSSLEIFDYLAGASELFPPIQSIRAGLEKQGVDFLDFATKLNFDINKNVKIENGGNGSSRLDELNIEYKLHLRFALMPFLETVIEQGILNGKVNANTLVKWLAEKTWLGQELEETNSGKEVRRYNWLGLLAPSLLEFFVQKEASLKSKNIFTNYVICIDSLTLKFEGILRDFAKRAGINTVTTGRNGQVREMYIEDILTSEKIGEFFHENDLAFFKYLFTASGVNLRNNVAHCYFRFQHYAEGYMILLILAVLRFGRYQL
ncbi:MAG: DUF4209 domain-containing protein [Saprospiraceae bacterium]|nr:DUF4209 domain-containing protein [Saprospiraceae bacterium]